MTELQDRLLSLYSDLSPDELGEIMEAAFEVAELTGRSEV